MIGLILIGCGVAAYFSMPPFEVRDHRDDAFSMSLTAAEQHEMDYLERTLTLKRREGPTYNFTVEQNTVDALFVFHSDVEKTRERLADNPR